LPSVEPAGNRFPGAVTLGQTAPGTPRAQDPEDAVEDGAVVVSGTTGAGLLRREQWTKPLPPRVSHVACFHVGKPRALQGLRTRPSGAVPRACLMTRGIPISSSDIKSTRWRTVGVIGCDQQGPNRTSVAFLALARRFPGADEETRTPNLLFTNPRLLSPAVSMAVLSSHHCEQSCPEITPGSRAVL
jgi:hypothetical protein